MPMLDALMVPPKSIWDPPEDEEKSTKSSSPRKHPSDMDEIELRVQLWDSYRLARIILGIPIKSFSLKSKTILHAIRIVAEMKLELIRLQKEVELAKLRSHTADDSGTPFIDNCSSNEDSNPTNIDANGTFTSSEDYHLRMEEEDHYKAVQKKQEEVLESTRSQLESIVEKLQQTDNANNSTITGNNKSSNTIDEQTQTEGNASTADLPQSERSQVLQMVQQLMEKVEATSQHLNGQFHDLHNKLQMSRQGSVQDINNLNKKLRTRQTIHSIELESNNAKHLQQIMDMSGQLESYKEQVERQQEALVDLTTKYEELESIAVTSDQAKEVLKAIESLEDTDAKSVHEEVQIQVVEILKRMAIMHSRNQREKQQLDNLLEAAQTKEHESEDELAHLNLQMEMLTEETKIPPEEFAQNMAYQRMTHKRQLTEILKREEKRLVQMEYLEVRLTELAFTAVEIEDLQQYITESREEYKEEVEQTKAKQEANHKQLKALKQQVTSLLDGQTRAVQSLVCSIEELHISAKTDKKAPSFTKDPVKPDQEVHLLKDQLQAVSRVRQLEEALAQRDEEAARLKDELRRSQQRVEELELLKYPSDSECTSPLSSRSSS